MLPIEKIYMESRHSTADSKNTSGFKISLPNNITLPFNTAFYITDITASVSWYTVEARRNKTIYFRINKDNFAFYQCTIREGTYNTSLLAGALCKAINSNYPLTSAPGTSPTRFVPNANVPKNTITI